MIVPGTTPVSKLPLLTNTFTTTNPKICEFRTPWAKIFTRTILVKTWLSSKSSSTRKWKDTTSCFRRSTTYSIKMINWKGTSSTAVRIKTVTLWGRKTNVWEKKSRGKGRWATCLSTWSRNFHNWEDKMPGSVKMLPTSPKRTPKDTDWGWSK